MLWIVSDVKKQPLRISHMEVLWYPLFI